METKNYDVIIIGAGPGGLAAGKAAAEYGARALILEREKNAGGVLNQCIHDGFGLVRYDKPLSGPEYAARAMDEAKSAGSEIKTGVIVSGITRSNETKAHESGSEENHSGGKYSYHIMAICGSGIEEYRAKAIVLATGCRERTRGMISIPGSRPAGIYTAGVAQNLINLKNVMVGHRVVILGTGDIGLIMARRLTLEGAEVVAAVEIKNDASGLSRNVRQCLEDYGIPIYLQHNITRIIGKNRLETVEITPVDEKGMPVYDTFELSENGTPVYNTSELIDCDTLILSVGLIPENEVAKTAGVLLDKKTNGILTDNCLQTIVPGIFSCGNCRQVMDLADYVSQQGEAAGRNAALYAKAEKPVKWQSVKHKIAAKGIPEKGKVVCTLCPKGCTITVTGQKAEGYGCERGLKFALQEINEPERTFTGTVKISGGTERLLPVRSDAPVKLREMKKIAAMMRDVQLSAPVAAGEKIIQYIGANKVNIVAEKNSR